MKPFLSKQPRREGEKKIETLFHEFGQRNYLHCIFGKKSFDSKNLSYDVSFIIKYSNILSIVVFNESKLEICKFIYLLKYLILKITFIFLFFVDLTVISTLKGR